MPASARVCDAPRFLSVRNPDMPASLASEPNRAMPWWAWMPVAILLAGVFALWAIDLRATYEYATLWFALQLVFMALASWVTAYFLVRSFLATGSPGLLLVGGGIVMWGLGGIVAGAIGRGDSNTTVTIHNLCIWVSAAAQLMGAVIGASHRTLEQRGTWALGIFILAMCVVTVIGAAADSGATPIFFVEGRGGTLVRQTVLGSAIAMLLLTAAVLGSNDSRFARWYQLGLLLMSVGLLGVMLEPRRFSAVSWIGLSAQGLAGVYLVAAATAAARAARAHRISLAVAPRDARLRYGLALVFVASAWAIRLLFFEELGTTVPYILFFPAVMLASLYGGAGPGVLAATVSVLITNYYWTSPSGDPVFEDPAQWMASALFYADCLLVILVARAVQRARERVAAAEVERRFAQRAEQVLRDADRRKDAFLATLSHEVRNALAPISNSLEIMERARDNKALAESARATVRKQMAHLNRIVDDLLDISRITRDKLELRTEPVDIAAVVRASMEACQPLADREGHAVSLAQPDAPIHVQGDAIRLAQVLTNLLNNAYKYTERGGRIDVSVRLEEGEAVVSVKDNGIGIDADKLGLIFEPFTQLDQSIARSQGGLGIGLSLARRLVEMHGGALTAHSEGSGRGTEFVVRLPALSGTPAEVTLDSPAGYTARLAGRRILVADDNRDSADSFASLFRMTGNEVVTAYDGVEAVAVAEQFRPDVALVDIGMPKLDGYEVCKQIRAQEWGKQMVLIAHTGWSETHRVDAAGFDGHITKPADYTALTQLLDRLPAHSQAQVPPGRVSASA